GGVDARHDHSRRTGIEGAGDLHRRLVRDADERVRPGGGRGADESLDGLTAEPGVLGLDAHEVHAESADELGGDDARDLEEGADELVAANETGAEVYLKPPTSDGPASAGAVQPHSARAPSTSSWRRRSTSSTPSAPSAARPHIAGRPTSTARAPSASATRTSVPRRIPPSIMTSRASPAAATTSGSTASVAGASSSWRPPWFDTITAAAPC